MTDLTFKLETKPLSLRPILNVKINGVKTVCLFDTGARIPVYCRDTDTFHEWCKELGGAKEVGKTSISGFGVGENEVTVYEFKTFIFSDGKNNITFVNFKIAHLHKDGMACELILPISIIRSMGCFLNYVKAPYKLTLYTDRDLYYTGFSYDAVSIYTFDSVDTEHLNYIKNLKRS